MGARGYLLRKMFQAFLTLLFVLTFNFFLFRVLPGDPIGLLARSQRLTDADIAEQRATLGLDQPLPQQYLTYLRQTLSGNLGVSLRTAKPVTEIIASRLGPTLLLVGLGTLFATVLGILIGIKGGWNRGSAFDTTTLYGSMTLYSMPEGWLGMLLLILFSGSSGGSRRAGTRRAGSPGWPGSSTSLDHLFLPVLTLTLGYIGEYAIIMRSSHARRRRRGLRHDRARQGRARAAWSGASTWCRTRSCPTFTLIFLSFGFVLGGAMVVEAVFSWPGIGLLTYKRSRRSTTR